MALVILKRVRRFPGLKPCNDCNLMFEWHELYKDPRKPANTRRICCFDCIGKWGKRHGHKIAAQEVMV